MNDDILRTLAATLEQRKTADPGQSYVARLHSKGLDVILKKIGEEATEVVIAAKTQQKDAIVHEIADLWFHLLVLLSHLGMGPEAVLKELEGRFGRSGLEEKASRADRD